MHYQNEPLASVLITPCHGHCGNRNLVHGAELVVESGNGTFLTCKRYQVAIKNCTYDGLGAYIKLGLHELIITALI